MGLFNIFKKEDSPKREIVTSSHWAKNTSNYIKELLKGKVELSKKIKYPSDIGEEHPFDYDKVDKLIKRFGILSAIIDKHIDFMMSGGIRVKSEDIRAQTIIEDFMQDFDFDTNIRIWLRQAFGLGFSPMELSYDVNSSIDGMKILKSETIFVNREPTGAIKNFNQYINREVIPFEDNEIADLNMNVFGDEYYGMGLIYPAMNLINSLLGSNKEMHTLMSRKANTPIVFIGGDRNANGGRGEYPSQSEMDNMGQQFEWLNNKHEWTITDFWKPTTLDFGNIGDKFQFVIDNDIEMLYSAVQIPSVLMGKGSIPEGLAQVQMKAWELRIRSLQEQTEKIIEQKIFRPVLNANGIDSHVEVEWGLPSQQDINSKVTTIIEALKNPYLNPKLIEQLEMQMAQLMGIDVNSIENNNDERKREEEQEQPRVPGSNSNKPTSTPRKQESLSCSHESYTTQELEEIDNLTLKEFVGFNYYDYEEDVLEVLKLDKFEDLHGKTKLELEAGMLNSVEIDKLRTTLYDGFTNNKSVAQISRELKKRIEFKDRYVIKDGQFVLNKDGSRRLAISAKNRPITIARTEVIRISNQGAKVNYEKNDISEVKWVSANSDRTCPECSALNGVIFETSSTIMPPLHNLCRCSIAPYVRD